MIHNDNKNVLGTKLYISLNSVLTLQILNTKASVTIDALVFLNLSLT